MQAFYTFLGGNDMMAYLTMMAPRLVELRRVLKPTGSLYLHCDPTASHYLKLLCDAVFGQENYRNEIILEALPAKESHFHQFCQIARDIILRYSKTSEAVFHKVFGKHDPDYIEKYYRFTDAEGRRYSSGRPHQSEIRPWPEFDL